jgi:CRISPR-associated protein Cas1
MEKGATAIGQSLRLLERAAELNVMRGAEGAAAAAYFRAFDRMVRQPFVFERRSQHPAHNGVNALLNLGYTLLSQEIAGRAETVGLDPRIGYFHGVRYGRSSLALDLLEPFRVDVVDRLTLSALNRRVFSPDDFVDFGRPKGVRLTPRALKRYLSHYEGSLSEPGAKGETPRARVQRAVTELRNAVMAGQTHGLDLEPVDGVAEASDAP